MHARDPADLYKDKIEVSLDGRQIFYLFFGGAVIVGLVFVLGVMVGRRVEARGHVDPARAAAADPLAALDRLEGPEGLSFKGALTGAQPPTEVERAVGELEKARGGRPEAAAEKKLEKKPLAPAPAPAEAMAEKKPEKKPEPKLERVKDAKDPRDAKDPKDPKDPKKKKRSDGDSAEAGTGRFTLQLSSFQDRQEADAFLATLKAAGFPAYVSEADVGGKGTFYRVRIGTYRSAEAASDARSELERVTRKSASVMRL